MELKRFTYLLLMLITLIIPVVFSFNKRVQFFRKLKYLLPAIIFTSAIFILWDVRFTQLNIWSFNSEFITGLTILNLPIGEWLFFFAVPYFSMLIYETLKIKLNRFEQANLFLAFSLVLLVLLGLIAWFSRQKLFTFFTFFLLTIYFGYTIFRNRFKPYFIKFYLAYFIALIPFFIIRVIQTELPILIYNSAQIIGNRIINVPIENLGYFFLLFLMNVTIFEYLKERQFY
ncbi:MAG TPA: lycopene cyclase domain-containing protein [Draconibacterium sp.]|nr:lycopene cyclase domain-containing protein [Draconibacterium sp.]